MPDDEDFYIAEVIRRCGSINQSGKFYTFPVGATGKVVESKGEGVKIDFAARGVHTLPGFCVKIKKKL